LPSACSFIVNGLAFCCRCSHYMFRPTWPSSGVYISLFIPEGICFAAFVAFVACGSFTTQPLNPRWKEPRYPLYRRLGRLQSRSGRYGKVKILDPIRIRTSPFGRPTHIQTSLSLFFPSFVRLIDVFNTLLVFSTLLPLL
jgi:hypothetical protein